MGNWFDRLLERFGLVRIELLERQRKENFLLRRRFNDEQARRMTVERDASDFLLFEKYVEESDLLVPFSDNGMGGFITYAQTNGKVMIFPWEWQVG